AAHIPGCNMEFRKEALEAIGGFDSVFRTAGDDVDVCWRLRDRGGVIGYAPGAVVWHHRRPSIRRFWKQQVGYGKAEALLERKWPARYNASGQLSWVGRLYGKGRSLDFSSGLVRIYQGVWGTAPFQSLYESRGSRWSVASAPEWYLLLMQPLARLTGRLRSGLTPWRRRGPKTRPRFRPLRMTYWRDQREPPEDTLRQVYHDLLAEGAIARAGGEFDSWDLEVRGG